MNRYGAFGVCVGAGVLLAAGGCASSKSAGDDPSAMTETAQAEEQVESQLVSAPIDDPFARGINRSVLADGLVVEDLVMGGGEYVVPGQWLTYHFEVYRTDGTRIYATRDDEEPRTQKVSVDTMLEGLAKGLPFAREGGVRRVRIPNALAFGEREIKNPANAEETWIPAGADVVYICEIIEVSETQPAPDAPNPETRDGQGDAVSSYWGPGSVMP